MMVNVGKYANPMDPLGWIVPGVSGIPLRYLDQKSRPVISTVQTCVETTFHPKGIPTQFFRYFWSRLPLLK